MNRYALLLGLMAGVVGGDYLAIAQPHPAQPTTIAQAPRTVNYWAYNNTLSAYVDDQGRVDYPALQANRQNLDAFNASLRLLDEATYTGWSDAEQIAFWINAYNSLTLKSIIDETPIPASIRDIRGVWRFNQHPIVDTEKTLNDIEHRTLRTDFNEPRIHMALVCAARSCPYLRTDAYTGSNLDAQLDDQTRIFLARADAFRIDRADNTVHLSAIFDWFGQDWIPSYGVETEFQGNQNERAVLNFISNYLSESDRTYLQTGNYQIRYIDYDWSLNRQN